MTRTNYVPVLPPLVHLHPLNRLRLLPLPPLFTSPLFTKMSRPNLGECVPRLFILSGLRRKSGEDGSLSGAYVH